MSQQLYNRYMGVAVNGLIADAEFTTKDGLQAFESIGLGLAVVQRIAYPNQGRLPKANKSKIVFSGDLVTSNVINLKVNAAAMAPVTFSADNLTTMGLIVTAIKAIAGVANALLDATDTANHTIIVYSTDGLNCLVTDVLVTLGAGQVTATVTTSTTDVIYGVSIMSQAIQQPYPSLNAPILYANGAPVGCLVRGRIWTTPETAVTNGDAAYMRFLDGGTGKAVGQFRNDDDSGKAVLVDGMVWRSVTTAPANLALVDINEPQ